MPTDNPKISLYVPQQVYDRFKSFQEERKLSMSQAGIVVLAEYFGIEETIKEITEGTTIGGVTLAEFEQLKLKFEELEKQVKLNQIVINKVSENNKPKVVDQSKPTDKLLVKEPALLKLSDGVEVIQPLTGWLLAKRLGVSKNMPAGYKRDHTVDEFAIWSQNKDPDNIAWIPNKEKKGYLPKDKLFGELLSKLKKWIEKNR